jgi:lipopolysaccharide/colanic/teichoic acid biosynthesis glycosyltransferase
VFSSFIDAAAPLRFTYRLEPFIALLLAILIAPVAAVIGVVIMALSGQSPLVRHRRVGWKGEDLWLLKFRTMWTPRDRAKPFVTIEDLPEISISVKVKSDRRITSSFAAWCRRYSLDEIPQLFHIIRGEMSFVGPRPITRVELDEHYEQCAPEILSLRPGLTGLWQVMGRNRLTYPQRRRLDLLLVRRASPRFFLAILIRTIPCVLRGHGAY